MHNKKTLFKSLFRLILLVPLCAFAQTPPIIPDVDGTMRSNLLSIMNSTAGSTRYRNAFIKVGDSITESGSFLNDLGCQDVTDPGTIAGYGSWSSLIPTTSYFSHLYPGGTPGGFSAWCGIRNPFTRSSEVAMSGMLSSFALASTTACNAPDNTTLKCEISQMNPTFALIMFGTNDVISQANNSDLASLLNTYNSNMTQIVDICIAHGVIPILSTIPPLFSIPDPGGNGVLPAAVTRVDSYNQVVIDLASSRHIPLWNYHAALIDLGLSNHYGIDVGDGIHPNVYHGDEAAIFTSSPVNALIYGYNVRNLTALQVLQKMQQTLLSENIFASGFE